MSWGASWQWILVCTKKVLGSNSPLIAFYIWTLTPGYSNSSSALTRFHVVTKVHLCSVLADIVQFYLQASTDIRTTCVGKPDLPVPGLDPDWVRMRVSTNVGPCIFSWVDLVGCFEDFTSLFYSHIAKNWNRSGETRVRTSHPLFLKQIA